MAKCRVHSGTGTAAEMIKMKNLLETAMHTNVSISLSKQLGNFDRQIGGRRRSANLLFQH